MISIKNFPNYTTQLLGGLLVVLAIALLIGQQLSLAYAGSKTPASHPPIQSEGVEYSRGATFYTSEDEWRMIDVDEHIKIWMNERTELTYTDGASHTPTFTLIQGQIILLGSGNVKTGDLTTAATGTTSITNYSWLTKADITNLDGVALTQWGEDFITTDLNTTSTLETRAPQIVKASNFTPEESTNLDFYEYVESEITGCPN